MARAMAKDLLPDENLVLRVHRHWIVALRALWIPIVLLVLAALLDTVGGNRLGSRDVKVAITLGVVALAGLWVIVVWVRWNSSRLTVTDQRVILDSGILNRTSKVIALDRVQDVSTRQGVFGRVLGYGSVEIDAAGASGAEVLDHLPMPNKIRDEVFVQSERLRRGTGQGQPAPAPSPAV